MRQYFIGIVSGAAACAALALVVAAEAKNRAVIVSTAATPYYAEMDVPVGVAIKHTFHGDGTMTTVRVLSLVRHVKCEFFQEKMTDKLERVLVASQQSDECSYSFKDKGNVSLVLTCLGTFPGQKVAGAYPCQAWVTSN